MNIFSKILLFLFALLPICGAAQNHYEANIAVGGKAGMTMSKVTFSPSVPQTLQSGIMFGGSFRYMEEKHFGLVVEFNLEQRGWKEKFEGYDYQYGRTLTYIQIPILTHIYFGGNHIHGFFNAGPEVGYMIASSIKSNFDYTKLTDVKETAIQNRYTSQFTLPINNHFDYGISAGIGAEWIKDNHHSFTIEGRFYYGLGNIFGSNKKDVFSASNSMSIMVTLGYFYRLK